MFNHEKSSVKFFFKCLFNIGGKKLKEKLKKFFLLHGFLDTAGLRGVSDTVELDSTVIMTLSSLTPGCP